MYPISKKIIDFFISLISICFLWPFFLILACLIKLDSKGPVFFKQERVGKNKKIFKILKFRTMRVNAPNDIPTHLLQNPDAHITKVGNFLRKTSLDELPQILNILMGQMSVVGPRPALWNQYDLINERDKYGANDIKPGLTGWAQINGRDELQIEVKSKLDGEYVKKMSLYFDSLIVFKTFLNVVKSEGIKEGSDHFIQEERIEKRG